MSGKAFKDVGPLTRREFNAIGEDLTVTILDAGASNFTFLGSTRQLIQDGQDNDTLEEYMGDIDVGVEHPKGIDGFTRAVEKRFRVKRRGSGMVSIRYPLGARWVQVDATVGKMTYLSWSKAGDQHPIKGGARNLFWNAVLRDLSFREFGATDTERTRYVIDFDTGLYLVDQTKVGKTRVLKDWKAKKSTFITDDPAKIGAVMFGFGTGRFETDTLRKSIDSLRRDVRATSTRDAKVDIVAAFFCDVDAVHASYPGSLGSIPAIKMLCNRVFTPIDGPKTT